MRTVLAMFFSNTLATTTLAGGGPAAGASSGRSRSRKRRAVRIGFMEASPLMDEMLTF